MRYEDLLDEPEETLRSLCSWVALEYDPVMLEYERSREARRYGTSRDQSAKRLAEPPDSGMAQKWKTKMSSYEHNSIVNQAGCLLTHFGYEVAKLPARQRREAEIINNLLQPESIENLSRQAAPRSGRELRLRLGLRGDQIFQFGHFFTRNYWCWAKDGIRWQRTVAQMML